MGLAADEAQRPHSLAVDFLYTLLPFLIIGLTLWWYLRRSQRYSSPFMRRSLEYYERSEDHMQKMERIGERIAAALEALQEQSPKDRTER
jgi:hypothetical protein